MRWWWRFEWKIWWKSTGLALVVGRKTRYTFRRISITGGLTAIWFRTALPTYPLKTGKSWWLDFARNVGKLCSRTYETQPNLFLNVFLWLRQTTVHGLVCLLVGNRTSVKIKIKRVYEHLSFINIHNRRSLVNLTTIKSMRFIVWFYILWHEYSNCWVER